MSSTCDTTTCSPCDPYNNCGCVNPTTFDCVSIPGSGLTSIGITPDMQGQQAFAAINAAVASILLNKGKVLIDANDLCPEFLLEKLGAGLNISFTQAGTGCDKKLFINSTTGGVPVDINVRISSNDTTSDYLYAKIDTGTFLSKSVLSPAGNEKLHIDVNIASLISADSGNQITVGSDGKIKTAYSIPDGSETKIISGTGINLSGAGTLISPYILSINPSIQVSRSCFDGVWRNVNLVNTGNPGVTLISGQPQYRIRFDGSIEFKGAATYTVAFGNYSLGTRKQTVTIGNIASTCLTLSEQTGTSDLKAITYIDQPQASSDQITQQYGYIIRKSTQNLILEFQSSFTNDTTKNIVVNFDGCVSHPAI